MVEEAEQSGMSLSAVARKYGINPNQLFRWRKLLNEGALCAVGAEESVVPLSEVKELQAKVRELERLLGRKTMEVEILKDAIRIAREKNSYCGHPCPGRTVQNEGHYGHPGSLPVQSVRENGPAWAQAFLQEIR